MGLQADPVDPSVGIPKQGRQGGQRGDQAQREHGPARARLIHAAAAQAAQQRQCVHRQVDTREEGRGSACIVERRTHDAGLLVVQQDRPARCHPSAARRIPAAAPAHAAPPSAAVA
ncbi:hypothetical protein G6F50_016644 [Rhizopus delemar]|uniref:Uncharacterized protein n=1 Tax=Rhizopus delemar TaxID=936053 RepID=A0A9P6XSN8_9FUNG|nr:hypothetical protein G6F50_016644 [Rhizopus delemar]